jgi:5-enolpyruvylshikimate-3-phosphate synthase
MKVWRALSSGQANLEKMLPSQDPLRDLSIVRTYGQATVERSGDSFFKGKNLKIPKDSQASTTETKDYPPNPTDTD